MHSFFQTFRTLIALLALSILPAVGAQSNSDFRILDAGERSFEQAPALAIILSAPLDPKQDYQPHVQVTQADDPVDGAWILSKDLRTLYFRNIEPQTQYQLHVRASLKDAQSRPLGKDLQKTITTRALAAGASFSGNGLILPRKLARGLPVTSVNIDAVDVDLLRIPPENAAQYFRQFSPSDKTSMYELDRMHDLSTPVFTGRYELPNRRNQRTTTLLPILDIPALKEPGLYVAVLREPGRYKYSWATAYFYISDIGLMLRRYQRGMQVFAQSLASAQVLEGVEIQLLDKKANLIDQAITDSDGKSRLINPPKAHILMARKGKDVALMPLNTPALDLSEFAIDGPPQQRLQIFVYGPRDIYRPGETMEISALLRDQDGYLLPNKTIHAKLRRPDGRVYSESRWRAQDAGYFSHSETLPKNAQTGMWTLELRTDPASKVIDASQQIQVEEFLPERMRLALEGPKQMLHSAAPVSVKAQGDWLYGAPAAGNRLDAELNARRNVHPIASLKDVHFGNVDDGFQPERRQLPGIQLDDQGTGSLSFQAMPTRPASPIRLNLRASLFETGGRAIHRSLSLDLWPAAELVGVRPLFDQDRAQEDSQAQFEILRVNQYGESVAADHLQIKVIREERDYYWIHDENRGWYSEFRQTNYPVFEDTVSFTADKPHAFSLDVQWGQYVVEVTDPATQLVTRYRFEAGWGVGQDRGNRPDQVVTRFDKPAYKAGETARLHYQAPHDGEALILVESNRLLWSRRLAVKAGDNHIDIPVDEYWDRHDIYASVIILRPGSKQDRVTPQRAMGIAHLRLDRQDRALTVNIQAPDQTRPERDMQATVRVQGAKPGTYVTLAAVDTGVLNLTRFTTPDAHEQFFAKRGLGLEARDVYGKVIEGMQGKLANLRFGGDVDAAGGPKPDATVKILSQFHGPVALDANGEARIDLPLPDFNGEVRLMALAFDGERFGHSDHKTTIAAPVVAEVGMPRFLAPGDVSQLTVDLHNLSGAAQDLELNIEADAPLTVGSIEKTLSLKDGERTTLRLPLSTVGNYGVGHIRLHLQGEDIHIQRHWELAVRPAWPGEERVQRGRLKPGEESPLDAQLLKGLMQEGLNLRLELNDQPPLETDKHLKALLAYPYGCLEQTSSRAWPLLFAAGDALTHDGKTLTEAKRNAWIKAAITRLRGMQQYSGGFGLWDEHSPEEPWLTPYVAEFLLEAATRGYEVPTGMLTKALKRIRHQLRRGQANVRSSGGDVNHLRLASLSYGGYILSRGGRAPLSALRNLYKRDRKYAKSGLPLVHLGLALYMQGDRKRGLIALREGIAKARDDSYLGDYGSPIRDTALMLALLTEHSLPNLEYAELIFQLQGQLQDANWLSTQDRSALLRAARALEKHTPGNWSASLLRDAVNRPLKGIGAAIHPLDGAELSDENLATLLRNDGQGDLFYVLSAKGLPTRPQLDSGPATLTRMWYGPDGQTIDPEDIHVGDTILVHITATAKTRMNHALLVDLLPAGLEIENLNILKAQGQSVGMDTMKVDDTPITHPDFRTTINHQEYREDRFVAAVPLRKGNTAHLFYLLRAVTPGEYTVPPVFVEDMYRPALRSLGAMGRVVIKP